MPHKSENRLAYYKQYYSRNADKYRYRSMKRRDIANGIVDTITYDQYTAICERPCYYCGITPSQGADAYDNTLGHVITNCVSCCEKCNYILGDIPFQAKDFLKGGLTQIAQFGFMDNWTLPIKRK